MYHTIYPAMADFVNLDEKVALFIKDSGRKVIGVDNVDDSHTRMSMMYFDKLGFKSI